MASIGEQLREARVAQNKSLEELSSDTNISKKYLEALETDNYDEFPAEVYTKGFLKNYAKNLGLDVQSILDDYKKLKGLNVTHAYVIKHEHEKSEEEEKDAFLLDDAVIGERRKSRKGLVVALIIIILAILGVIGYMYTQNMILPTGGK